MKRISIILVTVFVASGLLWLSVFLFLQTTPFGRMASGARLQMLEKSPNYINGEFRNETERPDLTEGVTYWDAFWHNMTEKDSRSYPVDVIPSVKVDLLNLPANEDVVMWMGHSSVFMQLDGKRILIDPVLSAAASPVSCINGAFKGTSIYTASDFPFIDVVIISHDHWDHLDYPTMNALKQRIGTVICGIGTGEHFRRWGFSEDQIEERSWNEEVLIDSTLKVVVTPSHHNSGRAMTMHQALWASYVIQSTSYNIFYSGDGGYDSHFKTIGNTYGPFDLSIIECGQYDKNYKYTHMQPEESIQAAIDVKSEFILPVHWGKFTESNHAWDEPIRRIETLSKEAGLPMLAPLPGALVDLKNTPESFPRWWENVN